MDELNKLLAENNITTDELLTWLKSDSVYTCLRRGVKSPSSTGVDECDDSYYHELYEFINNIKYQK